MKNWKIVFTFDNETFETAQIEGKTYTDAMVNAMVKYPKAIITEVKEI